MRPVTGLSSRLLVMTVGFVMLVEVFVYAPSVARFRLDWLEQRVNAAQLTVIALEATPDAAVTAELANRLLDQVGAHAIVVPPTATTVRRGIFREEYTGSTLRDHLGLDRPANRFTTGADASVSAAS